MRLLAFLLLDFCYKMSDSTKHILYTRFPNEMNLIQRARKLNLEKSPSAHMKANTFKF